MRAVLADLSTSRYLWTAAASRVKHDAGWGRGGLLRLTDVAEPALPDAAGWLRIAPELSGICGTDLGLAHGKVSFVLDAYAKDQRTIPGHELVGVVAQAAGRFREGDRVVLNPVLSCAQRGFESCGTCAAGRPNACERFDQPGVTGCGGPGQGFSSAVGGGWGESLVAHESQCLAVASIPSRRAVLAEPASIGLHAAARWRRAGDRVVVVGAGTIGLLTIAALRMLHPDLDIIAVAADGFGAGKATDAGASRTLRSGPEVVESLAASDGGRVLRARMTKVPILEHGVDAVFDCVGSGDTIDLSLHLLRPGAALVLVGGAGRQAVDWTLVWFRELAVLGTVNSGPEPSLDGRETMDHVVEWLADPRYRVDGMVTHIYDLDQWQQAMTAASAGPKAQAVKVTLRPNPGIPLV